MFPMKLVITHAILISWLVFSCRNSTLGMEGTLPPDHLIWNELLQSHAKPDGRVDYRGFIQDKEKLEAYLRILSANPPDRQTWSQKEQLAYWINAYNAFTVKLIVDHYPVKSIRDLGPKLKIPLLKEVWNYKFFEIGGKKTSLDELEHGVLRKEFEEPRIHFAINCASVSCPPLLAEAFVADRLDEQLDLVASQFINDPVRNHISKDQVELSSIFNWFSGDFTRKTTLIEFLNQYSTVKISQDAQVKYLEYDWSLNE